MLTTTPTFPTEASGINPWMESKMKYRLDRWKEVKKRKDAENIGAENDVDPNKEADKPEKGKEEDVEVKEENDGPEKNDFDEEDFEDIDEEEKQIVPKKEKTVSSK